MDSGTSKTVYLFMITVNNTSEKIFTYLNDKNRKHTILEILAKLLNKPHVRKEIEENEKHCKKTVYEVKIYNMQSFWVKYPVCVNVERIELIFEKVKDLFQFTSFSNYLCSLVDIFCCQEEACEAVNKSIEQFMKINDSRLEKMGLAGINYF